MFSENNITTDQSRDLAHCTTLLIDLTRGTSPNFGRKTRGLQKWHLRYKTSDISETKRSRAKDFTGHLLVYGIPIGDKSGDLA